MVAKNPWLTAQRGIERTVRQVTLHCQPLEAAFTDFTRRRRPGPQRRLQRSNSAIIQLIATNFGNWRNSFSRYDGHHANVAAPLAARCLQSPFGLTLFPSPPNSSSIDLWPYLPIFNL